MFIVYVERVFDIVEVASSDDQNLFIGEIDDLCALANHLELLFVLIDVAVHLFLEIEIVRNQLVGLDVGGEFEKVDEYVVFAFSVTVQFERILCKGVSLITVLR